jgi:hypothetical protein
VPDEPSLGEVVRRLDRMESRLEEFIREISMRTVDVRVYEQTQREWERRHADLQRDLDDERQAREKADKALSERLDRSGTNWRQVLFNGILPSVFLLITLSVTILLALRGGK